ncbi:MAG: transferase hexapeptide repeat family protein [Methylacidiphilales bacterium]|nr:transferase hexapeptide repeat family protein [Candidatus Methylacidiphilales bacterium]
MPIYKIDSVIPVIHESSFVHPTAVIIGDVIIGKHCYIAPGACLRGDFGRIQIDEGSNIQDNCIMHSYPDEISIMRKNSHVGHGSILHGCDIGEDALIGMHAVVMDGAMIGSCSIVAACSFVAAKFTCPPRSLVLGIPAKVKREVTQQELDWKRAGTKDYQELVIRCQQGLVETLPLKEIESNRPKIQANSKPLQR